MIEKITKTLVRENSTAIGGGAFGDEGKGKLTDQIGTEYAKNHKVIIYGPNGGPNAGHTVEVGDKKIAFHQLPSGLFVEGATVILGGGKVLHPQDLLEEIKQVMEVSGNLKPSIKIDSLAVLSLNTHRAYEKILKGRQEGGKGSTGRGIAPAYADIVLRQPLKMRDLIAGDFDKFAQHYDFYKDLINGLNKDIDISEIEVPILGKEKTAKVGTKEEFINQLKETRTKLIPFTEDVYNYVKKTWRNEKIAYIFELSQATGLDIRFGVYPDVTGSNTTFSTIDDSTRGLIRYQNIEHRMSVIKGPYFSSVGSRKLPSQMTEEESRRIRDDFGEYGASTGRPRDITYLDFPALTYFNSLSGANEIAITHMDAVYPNEDIKTCMFYRNRITGEIVDYRPDQEFLNNIDAVIFKIPSWDRELISRAKTKEEIPIEAKEFIKLIEIKTGVPVTMITNGPKREQFLRI